MSTEDKGYDCDQEITDEELQQLIDKNEADSEEPGGISAKRREWLLRETENRIKQHPVYQEELARVRKENKPLKANGVLLTDEEKALLFAYASNDPFIRYLLDRRGALRSGASADEIDEITRQWGQHYGVAEEVLAQDFVGMEALKIIQIRRIKDEKEQDAALEALATENVLRRERQEAKQAVNELTDEWFKEQCKTSWKSELKYFFKHPLSSDAFVFILIILGIFTVGAIGALWVLLFDGLLGEDWAFFCYMALVVTIFVTVGWYSKKCRRRKHPDPPKRIFSDLSDVDFFR